MKTTVAGRKLHQQMLPKEAYSVLKIRSNTIGCKIDGREYILW
jgi:hypothetical protein